ncbi:EF-hand domain-containing protein [Vibrio algarum]|uniref:EF-hand domain-containing protein n=1 Tax=Vibrio algarum TaxID=3020714 RepID=A0ABT4YTV1_9VIBR|nr:EF-hand domain-containing protein [Vibrio sp. KJ40-1]MDB1125003.1 EF-hand domain-containing protein [Vibrio sp. KJ40-1]
MKKVIMTLSLAILIPVTALASDTNKTEPLEKPTSKMKEPMTAGELFNKLDADNDGTISKLEFLEAQPVMQPPKPKKMKPEENRQKLAPQEEGNKDCQS